MAEVAPFRAVRFTADAGDPSALTCPPYDVIGAQEREHLESLSPYNAVRLILGRDEPNDDDSENKYTRAAGLVLRWMDSGVLAQDEREVFYLYEQRYEGGLQRGILGAVGLDEDSILPHEKTMAGPVADRLDLMRTTEANLEPIICVYSGEDGPGRDAIVAAAAGEPLMAFQTDDGLSHALFAIDDVEAVRTSLKGVRLVIADGHHRHRTAQVYRDEQSGPGPWDQMMMLVVDATWSGPSVRPIHRTLSGLEADAVLAKLARPFRVEEAVTRDAAVLERELAERRNAERCFVLMDRTRAWWLTLQDERAAAATMPAERTEAWCDLDVAVLQVFVFDSLLGGVTPGFVHSAAEASEATERGDLAIMLAPTPFERVKEVAEAGESMPPKSTYFYPKPRSGVAMRVWS